MGFKCPSCKTPLVRTTTHTKCPKGCYMTKNTTGKAVEVDAFERKAPNPR